MSRVDVPSSLVQMDVSLPRAGTVSGNMPAWRDYLTLTKPRLNWLVLFATAAGFVLAVGPSGDWGAPWGLAHCLIGMLFCAAGGSVLNQWIERDVDRLMARTANRPLPAGRMDPKNALRFGAVLTVVGVVYLAVAVNALAALLAFATILSYTLLYTPMKRISSTSTLIGAVPGALPIVIGWVAARGTIDPGAWSLFLIVLVWQMPHFLAIAWFYREQYAAAGLPVLPVVDSPDGRRTFGAILTWSIILVPVALRPTMIGLAGPTYLVVALLLSLIHIALSLHLIHDRTRQAARKLFLWSVIHLPILFIVLIGDLLLLRS